MISVAFAIVVFFQPGTDLETLYQKAVKDSNAAVLGATACGKENTGTVRQLQKAKKLLDGANLNAADKAAADELLLGATVHIGAAAIDGISARTHANNASRLVESARTALTVAEADAFSIRASNQAAMSKKYADSAAANRAKGLGKMTELLSYIP